MGTLVVFRVGAEDAEFLVKEFEPIFTEVDIVNLPKYHILLKLMINGVASDPFSAVTVPASPAYITNNAEKTIKVSRERYSNPVAEVEEKISRWMGSDLHQESALMINEDKTEGDEGQEKTESAPTPAKQSKTEIPAQLVFVSEPEMNTKIVETEVEIPQKKFVDKPHNSLARSQPAHSHDHNRSQPQRSHNAPHHDHGRSQTTRNFSKNAQPQKTSITKKTNPIWDKVADLHHQRNTQVQQQNQENLGKIIESSFQSSSPMPKPEPDIQKPGPDQHRTVIKPGESHSM